MSVAYNKVFQEVANLLGAVAGVTAATADTNYVATLADATLIGPDFQKTAITDAVVAAIGEIVEAIASTPLHPERSGFTTQTAALASGAIIPRTDSGGSNVVIGVMGTVRDSSDSRVLLPVDVDKVRSFVQFASTVYNGFTPYWFAVDGQRIYHTRTNVVIDVCTYARPTSFAGNINLDDWHEGGLVMGAVAKLAEKEGSFADLYTAANAAWMAHIAQIRNYGNPQGYGLAQSAPSAT
jgi:hypothetical protein